MIYIDTSAIVKLYIKESKSKSVAEWIKNNNEPIPLTSLIELEFINALKLKQFRNELSDNDYDKIIFMFREHEDKGVYYRPSMDWAIVFTNAFNLSKKHTSIIGSRSLDILHISSALFLKTKKVLTFDDKQAQLAMSAEFELVKF